jgi:hypothetical protein
LDEYLALHGWVRVNGAWRCRDNCHTHRAYRHHIHGVRR